MGTKTAVAEPDLSEFDDADAIASTGRPCLIGKIAEQVEESRRKALLTALAAEKPGGGHNRWRYSGERIAGVVTGWGYKVSAGVVDRHRRAGCGCPR